MPRGHKEVAASHWELAALPKEADTIRGAVHARVGPLLRVVDSIHKEVHRKKRARRGHLSFLDLPAPVPFAGTAGRADTHITPGSLESPVTDGDSH